jgi:fructokinase
MKSHLVLGVGELLWDVFEDRSLLGGAPANFAVMASWLGNHAAVLSRIGRDDLGRQAVGRLDPLPVDASFLQIDAAHPTGRVTVAMEAGEPAYTIHQPAAVDFMELTDDWVRLAERADAICFGSLAQRCHDSRQTIQTLAAQTQASCIRVFDVNLRPPFYSSEVLQESLELASVLKMNDAELPLVLDLLGLPDVDGPRDEALRIGSRRLLDEFPTLEMIAVTCGGRGSMLVTREEWHRHPGIAVEVADTIGAGDAFTAAMTNSLLDCGLRSPDLVAVNEASNRWGSWLASQMGAMPELTNETIKRIEAEIAEHTPTTTASA